MKTIKFNPKLNLSKRTIANLDAMGMKNIQGGETLTKIITCGTCLTECCTDYNTCDGIWTCVGCETKYEITCACVTETCTLSGVPCCL